MKYFAILKDCLREAIDAKVLYVLLSLSTITILLVATISITPLSAEQTMKQFFAEPNMLPLSSILEAHKPGLAPEKRIGAKINVMGTFRLVKVELLRGEPDAPESDYALTVGYTFWPGDAEDKARQRAESVKAVREIFQDAEDFGYLRVGDVEPVLPEKEGQSPQFRVVLHGTPAMNRIWYGDVTLAGGVPMGWMLLAPANVKAAPVGFQLYIFARLVVWFGSWIAVMTGIVITSFFIPNMLAKGTVDMLLVKPLRRWLLLFYKFIGGLTFIFLITAYAIGGIWLALGLRTGLWPHASLLMILTITFFFALLYAISTLMAVLTRSTVVAILVSIVAWAVFFVIGTAHKIYDNQYALEQAAEKRGQPLPPEQAWGNKAAARVFRALHAVTPRTSDLEHLNEMIVFTDFMTGRLDDLTKFDNSQRNWLESFLVTCGWTIFFVLLACVRFAYKDY